MRSSPFSGLTPGLGISVLALLVQAGLPRAAPAQQPQQDVAVQFFLFGEASYLESGRDVSEGFSLGQLVGHVSASLDPRLSVFAEATLTPRATTFSPSLERVIVRYDVSDALKLSAGRYHTPISWWNTAYHHGSWLSPSVARPTPVAFSTRLFPIHFVGLLAEGSVRAGPFDLSYDGAVGNGRQETVSRPGDAGDDNGFRAVLGGIRLSPLRWRDVEVGFNAYRDRIPTEGGEVDETIFSGHVAVEAPLQLIAEYMWIDNEPDFGATGSLDSDAWYLHAGYRLSSELSSLQPYLRYESVDPAAGDPVLGAATVDFTAWVAGVRWDLSDYAALKGEFRSEDAPGNDGSTFVLDASFVIPNLADQP